MSVAKGLERVANEIAGLVIVAAGAYAVVAGNKEMAEMAFQWGLIYIFGTGALKIARRNGGLPNE